MAHGKTGTVELLEIVRRLLRELGGGEEPQAHDSQNDEGNAPDAHGVDALVVEHDAQDGDSHSAEPCPHGVRGSRGETLHGHGEEVDACERCGEVEERRSQFGESGRSLEARCPGNLSKDGDEEVHPCHV